MGEPSFEVPAAEGPPEKLLDSWKEIAVYLNRDVTTVQRWEKREGMPVHRHLHEKRGSVYALPEELDSWIQSRRLRVDEAETPPDVETQPDADTGDPIKARPRTRLWFALAAMGLLALLIVGWLALRGHSKDQIQPRIGSLAVLPFRNLSGDPSQEYLADGMTEALIGRLTEIHDLRVISHTSVMRFSSTQLSVPEIAKMLGVDAVVEGSVTQEGNRIRVTAQLIRGATDTHFWSETYNREMRDALTLESELAEAIAEKVQVTVTGNERQRLTAAHPIAPEVYESYLRGRFILDQTNKRSEIEQR